VERVTGLKVPALIGERRPGDPARLISDAARARRELGWEPTIAELDRIISTAWTWHQSQPRKL
jgi:UDP-glucose 4-epimerase